MDEMIVVTVRTSNFSKDFELPWRRKLSELYPRMLTVLKKESPQEFKQYRGIVFEKDGAGLLTADASLFDYGVCTGDYLEVVEEAKYNDIH